MELGFHQSTTLGADLLEQRFISSENYFTRDLFHHRFISPEQSPGCRFIGLQIHFTRDLFHQRIISPEIYFSRAQPQVLSLFLNVNTAVWFQAEVDLDDGWRCWRAGLKFHHTRAPGYKYKWHALLHSYKYKYKYTTTEPWVTNTNGTQYWKVCCTHTN